MLCALGEERILLLSNNPNKAAQLSAVPSGTPGMPNLPRLLMPPAITAVCHLTEDAFDTRTISVSVAKD